MTPAPEPIGVMRVFVEWIVMILVMIGTVAAVHHDIVRLGNRMSEQSLTEGLQVLCVAGTALICAWAAVRLDHARGYLIWLTTFFAILLIRENDAVFDRVYHGFWAVPALITLIVGGFLTYRNRTTFRAPFRAHYAHRSGMLMILGLLMLVVFSRLFGTGSLWEGVMTVTYDAHVKSVVQEGLELLGHALVFLGALLSATTGFGLKR